MRPLDQPPLAGLGLGNLPVFVLWTVLWPAVSWGTEPLEVSLRSSEPADDSIPSQGLVTARSLESDVVLEAELTSGRAEVPIGEGSRWEVELVAPGWWAAPAVVGDSAVGAELIVHRTGRLEGTLRFPRGVQPSEAVALWATFSAATGGTPSARRSDFSGRVACEVEDSTWSCELPAAPLDVVLRPPGFVPRYLWGADVQVGRSISAGETSLVAGASVSGWLEVEDGQVEPSEVVTRLVPEGAEAQQGSSPGTLTAVPDDRGFFQFAATPIGSYRIEAHREGYASATLRGVIVLAEREAQIQDALVLRRPLPIEIRLTPALSPWEGRWSLKLLSMGKGFGNHLYDFEGTADWEGWWTLEGAPSGVYQLVVLDDNGQRFYSEEVEISEQVAELAVQVPIVPVAGVVLLGDEPLEATLRFGGRFGAEAVRVRSDEEGRFFGLLGREGAWDVLVEATARSVRSMLAVEVAPSDETQPAKLEIRVPGTELRGTVKTARGDTAPSLVTVRSLSNWKIVQLRSEEDGTFEIVGLPEGPVRVEAAAKGNLSAEPQVLELSEQRSPVDVALILRERRIFAGRIVTSQGVPVPGAEVLVYPVHDPLHTAPRLRTDGRGVFRARLPAGTTAARLVVDAPGFALRSLVLPCSEGGLREIRVHQGGGVLTVDLPGAEARESEAARLYVRHGGTVWSESTLRRRAAGADGMVADEMLRVPGLEEGLYEACWLQRGGWLDLATGGTLRSGCSSGLLVSGGELRLRVVPPPASDR